MVEYKDRLDEAMRKASLTTQQLADELKTSYQTVKKVLDGKSSSFSAVNNSLAAKACGVSSDWLATGTGEATVMAGWPFEAIDLAKILALDERQLLRLEGAFLASADQLGVDVKTHSGNVHGKRAA